MFRNLNIFESKFFKGRSQIAPPNRSRNPWAIGPRGNLVAMIAPQLVNSRTSHHSQINPSKMLESINSIQQFSVPQTPPTSPESPTREPIVCIRTLCQTTQKVLNFEPEILSPTSPDQDSALANIQPCSTIQLQTEQTCVGTSHGQEEVSPASQDTNALTHLTSSATVPYQTIALSSDSSISSYSPQYPLTTQDVQCQTIVAFKRHIYFKICNLKNIDRHGFRQDRRSNSGYDCFDIDSQGSARRGKAPHHHNLNAKDMFSKLN